MGTPSISITGNCRSSSNTNEPSVNAFSSAALSIPIQEAIFSTSRPSTPSSLRNRSTPKSESSRRRDGRCYRPSPARRPSAICGSCTTERSGASVGLMGWLCNKCRRFTTPFGSSCRQQRLQTTERAQSSGQSSIGVVSAFRYFLPDLAHSGFQASDGRAIVCRATTAA
jgi:hypothetical protein